MAVSDLVYTTILTRWESLCGGPSRLRDIPHAHWRLWMADEAGRVRVLGASNMADAMDRISANLESAILQMG